MTRLTYLLFLALCASLCFSSCNKDDKDIPEKEPEEEEEETLSLITACKYDIMLGDEVIASDPTDEWLWCATNSFSTSDDIGNIVIPSASIEDDSNNFNLYLSRGILRVAAFDDVPTNTDFEALFHTGVYDITREDTEGIQLVYGANGELWSTDNGSNAYDQTGSTFTIMEMVSGTGSSGEGYYVTIRGEFSCKMYNPAGDMKTSSGKLTVQFQNF